MHQLLITGTSGFVGKNLVNYFNNREFNLFSFSRKKILNYNLIDTEYLNINKINTIIHLAGIAHDIKNCKNEQDYYEINTDLTKRIFDAFVESNATNFIYFSSVKAVIDVLDISLTEEIEPSPQTVYGKSKLAAENYILSKSISKEKNFYILRPCMIHGPGNKGNLNLLYKIVSNGIPWPLGAFENRRSFCSIDNLSFIIEELINSSKIQSGIYNISDDEYISTNEIVDLIGLSINRQPIKLAVNKKLINLIARFGDIFNLPLNSDRLQKLTENYVVSNQKIIKSINKKLPLSTKEGLIKTFQALGKKPSF